MKFRALNFAPGSSFSWDLGSGFGNYSKADSTKINIFITAGVFGASLKIKDSLGNICTIIKDSIVTVGQATNVDIRVLNPVLCNRTDSALIIDSTSNVAKREWVIDGIRYKNAPAAITAKFTSAGYKSIALIVTNTSGCVYTRVIDSAILVRNSTPLNFTGKATTFCPTYIDTFWNTTSYSGEKISNYSWSFPGASPNTSSDSIPKITYADTGSFDVSLTLTYTNGCVYTLTKKDYIKAFTLVKPELGFSTYNLCNNDTLVLTNNTPAGNVGGTYSVNTYLGAIMGGSISTTGLKVSYSNAGKHSLKISYTNVNCAADTTYDSVIFVSKIATFIKSDTNIFCNLNDTINFRDSTISSSGGPFSFQWEVRMKNILLDTSTSRTPTFVFSNWGKYTVSLTATNGMGCSIIQTKPDYVILDTPVAKIFINPRFGCVNDTIYFFDKTNKFTQGLPKYKWFVLDTDTQTVLQTDTVANPRYQFTSPGRYFVKLIVYDEKFCADTLLDSVGIEIGTPKIDFMLFDDTVCSGEQVSMMKTTMPDYAKLKYSWQITHNDSANCNFFLTGDSVGFSPVISGYYNIKCIGTGPFCADTLIKTKVLSVNRLRMNALVDTASNCVPVTISGKSWAIENVHLSNTDTNLIYIWDAQPNTVTFSNGLSANTAITFNQGGCYQLGLQATNSNGCVSSVTGLFAACVGEIAEYTTPKTVYCANDTIFVTNTSKQNTGYKWYIKNNLPAQFYPTDTSTNPQVIFLDSGSYELALIASTSFGCNDTFTTTISSKKPYTTFYSPDSVSICGPTTVEFKANSVGGISYSWDFGDGSPQFTTASSSTFHIFSIKNGKSKYDIDLRVLDASGCKYQIQKKQYIKLVGPSPYFNASSYKGCGELEVTFADSGYGVAKYYFNNGKGSFDTLMSGKHIFKATDTLKSYTAYLPYVLGYDSSGQCSNLFFAPDSIRVYNIPKTNFTSDLKTICERSEIHFSSTGSGYNKQYWSFSNPYTVDDTVANPKFMYNNLGKFAVKLVSQSKDGCFDTLIKPAYIHITPRPRAAFYMQDTLFCSRDSVPFISSSIFKVPIRSYHWDFGDDQILDDTADQRMYKYRYKQPGIYGVRLTITDTLGCIDSFVKPNHINISKQEYAQLLKLYYTTVLNDSQIEIKWSSNTSSFFEKYILFRDSIGSISPIYSSAVRSDTAYIDRFDVNIEKRNYKYGIVGHEMCTKKLRPERLHQYIYAEIDTLSPAGLQVKWNPYRGWDSSWRAVLLKTTNIDSGFYRLANLKRKDSSFHDYPLCDSLYHYQIRALHLVDSSESRSNIVSKRPFYRASSLGTEITSVSVDENNIVIKWDTLHNGPYNYKYHLNRQDANQTRPNELRSLVVNRFLDEAAEPGKMFYIYSVVREDYCGTYIEPGNPGNSIYLNAKVGNDTVYLAWNSYRYWKNGVKNYYVQLLNTETNTFENLARLNPTDTIWTQNKLPNLLDPNFCYRVLAIGKDRTKADSSFSNKSCVVLPAQVYVPNAFTPNGDGINDQFKPVTSFIHYKGNHPSLQYHFYIYDRWGEKVFETDNIFEGWNGMIKDQTAASGVYYYRVLAFPYEGYQKINLNGQFILLR